MTYNTKSWLTQLAATAFLITAVTYAFWYIDLPRVFSLVAAAVIGVLSAIIFEHDRARQHFHEKYPFASKDFPS